MTAAERVHRFNDQAQGLDALAPVARQEVRAIESSLADALLNHPPTQMLRGRPDNRIMGVQHEVLKAISTESCYQHLSEDSVFLGFASKMGIRFSKELGLTKEELAKTPVVVEALIEHLKAHYALLKDIGLPNSLIKAQGHKFTLWDVNAIVIDAERIFGADPATAPLARTAADQVLQKRYASVAEAKQFYDAALADARAIFGSDADSETVVRTAAMEVFMKVYASIAEAKQAYDAGLAEARRVFGGDTHAESFIRTVALGLFIKKFASAEDALARYERNGTL